MALFRKINIPLKTSLCGFIHALLYVRDPNKSEDGENARAFMGRSVFVVEL